MRNALAALVLAILPALSGCVTSENARLQMRVHELEQVLSGKDEDLGYLMEEINKRDAHIYRMEWRNKKLLDTCET